MLQLLEALELNLHPSQVSLLVALQQNKALIRISPEYANYANYFFANLAIELPKNTGITKYAIKLIEDKQLSFGSIYSLSPVELETLKT